MKGFILALGMGLLLVPTAATGATNTSTTSLQKIQPLALKADLRYTTSLHEENDAQKKSKTRLRVLPSYKIDETLGLTAKISLSQKLNEDTKTSIGNTPIELSYTGYEPWRGIQLATNLSATLPTNEDDRKDNTFNGALGLSQDFSGTIGSISATYSIGYTRNFYQLTHNKNDEANFKEDFSNGLLFSWQKKAWKITVAGEYAQSWTYKGGYASNYLHLQELGYVLNEKSSIAFGHRVGGDALTADGRSSDIQFFDGNTSLIYSIVRWAL